MECFPCRIRADLFDCLANHSIAKAPPVHAADIFRSLSMLLRNDISMRKIIAGEDLDALKEFLHVLCLILPTSKSYRKNLISLSEWVNTKTILTGRGWLKRLKESKFPLYDGPFIECKGSEPQYRGYPCGLWLLWHSLTVRQYELTRAGLVLPPDLVVHAMNRFMPRFFSCIECSYHFAAVTASLVRPGESILPRTRKPPSPEEFSWDPKCASMLLPSPGSSEEQVLFLSTIHNRVNLRLARTVTEDPKAPKQLYPTQSMCPSCWSDDPEDRGTQSMGNNPETRENWFNFLVNRYSSNSWQTDGVSTAFLSKDEDTRAEKCRPSLVLTSVGVTLFAMVGLVVLVLLLRYCKQKFVDAKTAHVSTDP